MHLLPEGLDCPNIISTNNSRPKRPQGNIKQIQFVYEPKRCDKLKPVADVSVRLFSMFLKVSSFQVENKSKNSICLEI